MNKVYKVTSKNAHNSCYVAAKNYDEAVAKLVAQNDFNFLYGGGFTIEKTNETFVW